MDEFESKLKEYYEAEGSQAQLLMRVGIIQDQIEMGGKLGIDFSEEESLLWGAILMIEGGDEKEAKELVDRCAEKVNKVMIRYELLVNTIASVKKQMKIAFERGGDIEEVKKFLILAEKHFEEGNYKDGVNIAIKCAEMVKAEIGKYDSWRTELDTWKE